VVFVLLPIVWLIAELFVAIKVADAIGVLLTVILLIASWPIGGWLMRAEGRTALRRLSEAIAAGRPPGKEVLNGALAVAGGVLLIVPGFITDVLGLALMFAPTRSLARRVLVRNFQSRIVLRAARFRDASRPYDVDSTATDIDSAQLHR
jgi:UPF0716 protein FxsA